MKTKKKYSNWELQQRRFIKWKGRVEGGWQNHWRDMRWRVRFWICFQNDNFYIKKIRMNYLMSPRFNWFLWEYISSTIYFKPLTLSVQKRKNPFLGAVLHSFSGYFRFFNKSNEKVLRNGVQPQISLYKLRILIKRILKTKKQELLDFVAFWKY